MCNYHYVFFDLDGTIADTDLLVVESYRRLFRHYYPHQKIPFRLLASFSGPSLKSTITKYFPDYDLNSLLEEFKSISLPLYEVFASLYLGIESMLQELKRRGVKIALITSKMRTATEMTFKILNLEGIFDCVITLDDVHNPKPDPEGIKKALDFFQASPSDTIYVGDADSDFLAAKNANIDCALVSWNIRGRLHAFPKYYVDSPDELLEVIFNEE